VPSFTVLKTQICVTRPQCVKLTPSSDNAVRVYDSNVTIMQPNVSVNGPIE